MRALGFLALALCGVSTAALLLCLFTEGHDALCLPLALISAAAANMVDRFAERRSQKGVSRE